MMQDDGLVGPHGMRPPSAEQDDSADDSEAARRCYERFQRRPSGRPGDKESSACDNRDFHHDQRLASGMTLAREARMQT